MSLAAEKEAVQQLRSLADTKAELKEDVDQLESLFTKKHWHETTELLLKIILEPRWDDVEILVKLFTGFVKFFQLKMNLFSLGRILLIVTGKVTDDERALTMLRETAATLKEKDNQEAHLLLNCEEAIRLIAISRQQNSEKHLRDAKEIIEKATKYLSTRETPSVNADFRAHVYLAEAAVFKLEGNHDGFYEKCLLYVAHIDVGTIPLVKQQEIAFDLAISALLGSNVHNFGELLNHPVLLSLEKCNNGWLVNILKAFNVGDIDAYNKICKENEAQMKQYIGESKTHFLQQKIQVMALLYHLFVTPVHDRVLSFQTIKEKCKLENIDQVEPLLLRSLALGLVRGLIDEVKQTVEISWIASRALGREEVSGLLVHMNDWIKQVSQIHSETASVLSRCELEA